MKTGACTPGITPLPCRPDGVGECRRSYGKDVALPLAGGLRPCGGCFADTRPAESGAVAGGNRSAGRSRAVSPGVGGSGVSASIGADGCGALGCRRRFGLWVVLADGERRVLCTAHALRWVRRTGAALSILPMPTLPPLRGQNPGAGASRRRFRVKT
jgi:hypothetical protein